MLSQIEENYIKAIYNLSLSKSKRVSTNLIAKRIETKASSVTDMIQKLSEKGLVDYIKYQGVCLTDSGYKIAVKVVRNHRLWEVFLVDKLSYNWDEVHELAEQLEHIKSNDLTEKLDAFLNYPSHDPHGDPIPDKEGNITHHKNIMLSSVQPNEQCVVIGVMDSSSTFLKYLDRAGIELGSIISILRIEEFDGSMEVKINGNQCSLSNQITKNLYIKKQSL